MQTKDIISHPLATEWAVIRPWDGNRSRAEDSIETTEYRRTVKVQLVNTKRYKRNTNYASDHLSFQEVSANEKTYGFLVSFTNKNGETLYAVTNPQNFIALWSEYNAYWQPELARRKALEAELEAKRLIELEKTERRDKLRNERRQNERVITERLAQSITESIATLLGSASASRSYISTDVDGEWVNIDTQYEDYRITTSGTVRLELKDFQRLLEYAIEGKG